VPTTSPTEATEEVGTLSLCLPYDSGVADPTRRANQVIDIIHDLFRGGHGHLEKACAQKLFSRAIPN